MPITAEQSYALGTKEGRDRINQQLRANPQYVAFLRSLGVTEGGRLSDQQRKMAADWVRQNIGPIGGLEIDPSGNLNNPQGFGTQFERWGLPAAAGATMAFGVPGLFPGLVNGALSAPAATSAGTGVIPSSSIPGLHEAVPGAITSQGVSGTLGTAAAGGAGGAGRAVMDAASEGGGGLLKKIATPDTIAGLGALIAGLVGSRNNDQQSEELQRINAITETQMRRADPLHQVAVNLAFGRMPVNYRQGVQLTNEPLPPR